MKYFTELKRSMEYLASNPKTVFLGQAVSVPGTAMSNTLKDVKQNKLIERNYNKYFKQGDEKLSNIEDYTSHNTKRLDRKELKELLLSLPYVQELLNS